MNATTHEESLGASVTLGLAAVVLGALPAALRSSSLPLGWLALSASAALLGVPLVVGLRQVPGLGRRLLPLGVAALLAAGPWALLAGLLKTATHHRPLGAVSFGVAALALGLGAWALTARVAGSRHAAVGLGLLGVAGAALLTWRALPALGDPALRTGMLDVVAVLGMSLVAGRVPFRLQDALSRSGVVLALGAVLLLSGAFAVSRAQVVEALDQRAPALLWPARAFLP